MRRKTFQFGVGTLLWTIVLVAVLSAWHVDRIRLSSALVEKSKEVERIKQSAAEDRLMLKAMVSRSLDAEIELKRLKDDRRSQQQAERELITLVRQHEAALLKGR
jgi:hypothetical protein